MIIFRFTVTDLFSVKSAHHACTFIDCEIPSLGRSRWHGVGNGVGYKRCQQRWVVGPDHIEALCNAVAAQAEWAKVNPQRRLNHKDTAQFFTRTIAMAP